MIVIIGASASGKTTLVKNFVKKHPEYHKLVTYTTRPKRPGEEDGIDYHFISEYEFDSLADRGFFIEFTKYREWSYGVAKDDCLDDKAVAILTPAGLRALKRNNIKTKSVYLSVDRRSRLINILARGDDVEEAYRRNLTEVGQFDGLENEVDYVIFNDKFLYNEDEILRSLEYALYLIDCKKQ